MHTVVKAPVVNGYYIKRDDETYMPTLKGTRAIFSLLTAQAIALEINRNTPKDNYADKRWYDILEKIIRK